MKLKSTNWISFLFFFVYQVTDVGAVEVSLLSTEGVTTNLGWKVHNKHEDEDFGGWEDLSILFKNRTIRGYQVCLINYDQNTKPQSWLLIPGIDIKGASRIFIEMNFTMRECSDIEKTCRETFSVFYRLSDSKNPDKSDEFNPVDYMKIDTVAAEVRFSEPSATSPDSWNSLMNKETVNIKISEPTESKVVHIGIVDVGACMALMGVRVYHKVCPRVVEGLAIFNETMTGASDTSLVPVIGSCVPFSTNPEPSSPSPDSMTPFVTFDPESSDLIGPLYHCTSSGEWQVLTGECQCVPGHQPDPAGTACVPCESGTHKPSIGNEKCSVCPVHSNTATTGAETCECDSGFYSTAGAKIKEERPTGAFDTTVPASNIESSDCNLCSKLPSPPNELKVKKVNSGNPGSIQLVWTAPLNNGGCSDVRFCVTCEAKSHERESTSEEVKDCSHISYQPSRCNVNQFKVIVGELRGHATYKFTVTSYSFVTMRHYARPLRILTDDEYQKNNGTKLRYNAQEMATLLNASSATLTHQTESTLPSSVRDVALVFGNQSTMSIKWREPRYTNGEILYYEVQWSLVFEDIETPDNPSGTPGQYFTQHADWNRLIVNDTYALLTQLYPGSSYDIIISAYNSAGSDNDTVLLRASTSPIEEPSEEPDTGPTPQPYLIATVVIAVLVVMICIVLALQWKYRSRKTNHKQENGVTGQPKEFRPFNSHHESLDQRTYVDPFSLDAASTHRFLCEISPESIVCETVIGCGEFGEVYKGTLATIDLKTGQETTIEVAVKQLRDQCEPQEQVNFLREAMSLQRFRHPNIVHLEAVVTSSRPFFIVTELMDHGSLHGYLTKLREKSESESEGRGWTPPISHVAIANMLRGVARGMEYLSGRGFVHRDLAARNVLINADLECKVADFGLTREVDCKERENGTLGNGNGTYTTRGGKIAIRWTAPEAMAFRTFTQFSDVWSFGILTWEAASFGEKPYWDLTNHEVMKAVNDGFRLPAPEFCPSVFHHLMFDCWHQEHKNRPTFTKIIGKLDHMISVPDLLLIPSSPASSGFEENFFPEEMETNQRRDNLEIVDEGEELTKPLLTTVMVHRHNHELANQMNDKFKLANHNEDEGSEASSYTSTICASEVTVCPANGAVVYVPLCRSNSEEYRSESPLNMRYSPKTR